MSNVDNRERRIQDLEERVNRGERQIATLEKELQALRQQIEKAPETATLKPSKPKGPSLADIAKRNKGKLY